MRYSAIVFCPSLPHWFVSVRIPHHFFSLSPPPPPLHLFLPHSPSLSLPPPSLCPYTGAWLSSQMDRLVALCQRGVQPPLGRRAPRDDSTDDDNPGPGTCFLAIVSTTSPFSLLSFCLSFFRFSFPFLPVHSLIHSFILLFHMILCYVLLSFLFFSTSNLSPSHSPFLSGPSPQPPPPPPNPRSTFFLCPSLALMLSIVFRFPSFSLWYPHNLSLSSYHSVPLCLTVLCLCHILFLPFCAC